MTTSTLTRRPLPSALLISAAWLIIATTLGAAGLLTGAPSDPPIAIGIAAGAPVLAALAVVLGSPRVRAWAQSLDLRLLTNMQMWRIGGGFALLVLGLSGDLPRSFALPAGIGDIIVALTAPLIATYVIGTRRRWIFAAWTAFGIADLINAVALGLITSPDMMGTMPIILIPAFGVPFAFVLHILSVVHIQHWDNGSQRWSPQRTEVISGSMVGR